MARSRNLKPGFFTNVPLADLPPLARLLFAGLWPHCDREGRITDCVKKIKVLCLPFDDCDVDALLDALAGGDDPFILRYEVDGKKYIQVLNWHRHQTPYAREPESVIPACNPKHIPGTASAVLDSCLGTKSSNYTGTDGNRTEGGVGETTDNPFEAFWRAVPRKVGKADAKRAWINAIKVIRGREATPGYGDAQAFLLDRITAFAASPKAKGEFCPHPATWLNGGRYDDDPAAWRGASALHKAESPADRQASADRAASEREASEARRQAAIREDERLERECGAMVDALPRLDAYCVLNRLMPNWRNVCKPPPHTEKFTGTLRHTLLLHFDAPAPIGAMQCEP
jgi:hypothetical protein